MVMVKILKPWALLIEISAVIVVYTILLCRNRSVLIDFVKFCNFEHLIPRMNNYLLFHKWMVSVQNQITVFRGKLQIK